LSRSLRSPFLPVVLPVLALAAGAARWAMQGSGNVYTATQKRDYVPDRDLGWRVVDDGPLWLGLEALAIVGGVAVAVAVAGWIIRRVESKRTGAWTLGRAAQWAVAALTLAVPVAAFASGGRPAGGRDELPADATAAAPTSGIEGHLGVPAGTYEVVASPGTAISARISSGGEAFDARFPREVTGTWKGDPNNFGAPMSAEVSVATEVVDTGITLRSQHAREEYLLAAKHPRLGFRLDRIVAARQDAPDRIAFRARGTALMMGKEHAVEVTGTLRALDAAGAQRVGVTGTALVAQADFSLPIRETGLAADAKDFDGDRIPIHASLVLVHRP
jgi:hypothetical protein